MITGIIIILLMLALIGSIIHGQRLIKRERVDAVFGNPERSKGGWHWVVAGTSSILLLWFYFSWDAARSYFPKFANEMCQVAKVNYAIYPMSSIFPIESRTLKSTSIILRENTIMKNLKIEIQNSNLDSEEKSYLNNIIIEMESTLVSLTSTTYLESEIPNQLNLIANKINILTSDLQKTDNLEESSAEEIEGIETQPTWGETGIEVPVIPQTTRGKKFDAASKRISLIVDEFFMIKNLNPLYLSKAENIEKLIKNYSEDTKNILDEKRKKLRKNFTRNIKKIFSRITRSNIFPPNTLDEVEKSLRNFQIELKIQQGSLRFINALFIPGGSIVATEGACSEQGSGRWLPKPTDTLKIFLFILQPSEGYKNEPLLWYKMKEVNEMIGFITPDWVADIIPGKYPRHKEDGTTASNFKSRILQIATGEFQAFKVPVPAGHIWDSLMRVFLGLFFGVICGVPLGLFMGLSRFAKGYFDPMVELYRPVPPLAWAPLILTIFGIGDSGKIFLLFMVAFAIMVISARAGATGTQLSKIHAAHSLGASKSQILREVIFPNSLPEILTGIRVSVGVCWGTLVAAEFLAGTTGIGFVENVARKYMQYEIIWVTIFVMGMLGMLFDLVMRWIINKTIPWRGKG